MRQCSVEGCSKPVKAKGYCNKHYQRLRKNGDPLKAEKRTFHGLRYTVEYQTWLRMKDRCLNKFCNSYHNYGARGITIYQKWIEEFTDFYNYIGERPSDKHSLDRIDANGNYEPGNIRWADKTTQNRNQNIRKDNTSGVKGVTWYPIKKKWLARINTGERRKFLGYFEKKEDAIKARKEAEKKYWGD